MPSTAPHTGPKVAKLLKDWGKQIKTYRKKLGITAAATAESAGMSRVTLHRIEKGESSVTIGAYLNVISALGLRLDLLDNGKIEELPPKIIITDYPELERLAWQLKKTKQISPKEALELYERNWRHLDLEKLKPDEQKFIRQLLKFFGRERLLV